VSIAVGQMTLEAPDEALVDAARAGDRAAFAALVTRYREVVFAYALARLRDREEAEDMTQDTFVRAFLAVGRLRGPGTWEAWLMRILRNLCHDAQRRKQVRQTEPIDDDWWTDAPSPEVLAIAGERRRELSAAVGALPEKYRVPLLMHYAAGRTYREIAAALGLPESTVVGRLAGALRRLRRQMGVEGGR
jgi:RNA polymerase sigma-70 factor, ECF subfamily